MEIKGKKHIALYLTDWQIRMVKDLLGVSTHVWTVPVESGGGVRYMGPGARSVPTQAKRMYLTEWQRKEIKDETGEDCEFIEIVAGSVLKYQPPTALARSRSR